MSGIFNYLIGGIKSSPSISDKQFVDFVKDTNILGVGTKRIYVKNLSIILNEFEPRHTLMFWLTHPEQFKFSLLQYVDNIAETTNKKLSVNTYIQFVTVMISLIMHHIAIQEAYPELMSTWKRMKNDIAEDVIEKIDSNTPTKKQRSALFTFEQLEELRDSLPSGSDERLLISLYTMIPPVRADFSNTHIYFNADDAKGRAPEDNYIVMDVDRPEIVLKKYKTKNVYGDIIIPIPNALYAEITMSLNAKPREYLFTDHLGNPYSKKQTWNIWANRTLKKVTKNDNFSITMFRHIYLSRSDLDLGNKTRKQRKEISSVMGHSLDMQDRYTWKHVPTQKDKK